MTDTGRVLISALKNFGLDAEVAEVQSGAAVDRYALKLAAGVKVKQVMALADDLAVAIAAPSVRVLPIPGTVHVGVEVPAAERRTIPLEQVQAGLEQDHPLRFPVGVDVAGAGISARVDKLPHVIVAGATGSGKSVFVTAMLAHLVTHAEPSQLQLILIDPKRVELAAFAGIRHLGRPVVTDMAEAAEALDAALLEMDRRWKLLEAAGKKNVADLDDPPPYLVIVIDELADLMMQAGKRVEGSIVRLLQLGRAAGVHLILATQRPSTDVITGLIKTNAPSRMAFALSSHTDSNVALGQSGAERLLGAGDGLWWPAGASQPERIQSAFISDDELEDMLLPLKGEAPAAEPSSDVDELVRRSRERMEANREAREAALAAPSAPTPPEAPPAPPEAPPAPSGIPEAPPAPTPLEVSMPSLPADEIDEALELAYAKGRRHGQLMMELELPEHRVLSSTDWWVAIGIFLAATFVGVFIFPALIPAFGAWAAWTVVRRRTNIAKYRTNGRKVE